ncbi:MAG: glycosyl hydrolase [bacterium]
MRSTVCQRALLGVCIGMGQMFSAAASDLALSDPASMIQPPDYAVGFPNRAATFDVLPGFKTPPAGYGEVAFYWWLGDPLTKERLAWQVETLGKTKGVSGLQVNYAHSDKGGRSWGLTFPSEPSLFSEPWWNLYGWFMKESKKYGIGVSLSDYTLGIGQGWYMDEVIKENPEAYGAVLGHSARSVEGGKEFVCDVAEKTVSVTAYKLKGEAVEAGPGVDLRPKISKGKLAWAVPEGKWQINFVSYGVNPNSIDPMHPLSGKKAIEKFFQRFEDRNPGEGGKGLNFFFSDELAFGVGGNLWNMYFASEFKKRKGYDVVPELAALFTDIGPRTPKVRLDYHDVVVSLQEENYFKPVFDWHQKRGMIYGCDHGGRGRDVGEFGDYFRTQRWNQGPGCDQPGLGSDVIKNKVASSIAHLYLRPRTWLEGYYGSGWGTTTASLTDATFRNFMMGQNLLTLHGLYYSLHGGWWEWAPPCNHFRMPYWAHMDKFLACTQRLSYLLSQGHHRCDVAIIYPVAPLEAGLAGNESVNVAFGAGQHLYSKGVDFDFMDFESLLRAKVENKQLKVSGEEYRVLVLPAMKALRYSTLQKAADFYKAGGMVIALGALPEASDRGGREDAGLDRQVKELFGVSAKEAAALKEVQVTRNPAGGVAVLAQTAGQAEELIGKAFPRDFAVAGWNGNPYFMHRKIGPRDVFAVYGVPKNTECFFRASGQAELWDPWTGGKRPLAVAAQTPEGTTVKMPLTETEAQLVVFSPGVPETGAAEVKVPAAVAVDGDWEFELKPTMDNRWGDFRWPAFKGMIGAEMRQIKYAEETAPDPGWQDPKLDDSKWGRVTCSFGPKFWQLGPMPEAADVSALEAQLAKLTQVDPATPVEVAGKKYSWKPYEFSWRFGMEHDTAHQGYHGLKEEVADEFIGFGIVRNGMPSANRDKEEGGTRYYLWTAVVSGGATQPRVLAGGLKPAAMWLNNVKAEKVPESAKLHDGANPLLLRYDAIGRGFVVFDTAITGSQTEVKKENKEDGQSKFKVSELAMSWYKNEGLLKFDTRPGERQPAGWYRFVSPPGLTGMTLTVRGRAQVWVDGKEVKARAGKAERPGDLTEHAVTYKVEIEKPAAGPVTVALRVGQARGCYGGAALPEPISLDCGVGRIALGDWSKMDGLASYSGGAWYRKTIVLTKAQADGRTVIDLGAVAASAEVHVNGKLAGVKIAPPWKLDLSGLVRSGENTVEVLVYNTLANHYSTIPTNYRGLPTSGLIGPVKLEF